VSRQRGCSYTIQGFFKSGLTIACLNAVGTGIPFSDLFTIAVITGRMLLTHCLSRYVGIGSRTLNCRIDLTIFFLRKIQTLRDNLQKAHETNDNVVNVLRADVKFTGQHLTGLAPASSDEIGKLLVQRCCYVMMYSKQCSLSRVKRAIC
jgi:hypothetical protein